MNKENIRDLWSSQKNGIIVISLSLLYLLLTYLFIGLQTAHLIIVGIYNLGFSLGPKTRKVILAFTVFLVFGILYDLMRVYPNYLVNPVDISSLYHFEQKIFGLNIHHHLLTPNEFFANYHNTFMDLLAGFFYINWMPVPLIFGLWLYFQDKKLFLHFSFTFLFVNLLGFCIYYIHPAAPPWYVQMYGFTLHYDIPGNIAGLARFDNLIHFPAFQSIYVHNSNIFAAIPSLHCAYSVVVFYYALKSKMGWVKWLLGVFVLGICFAAVYSGHHYITDVILGIFCAAIGIGIYQRFILNIRPFEAFVQKYTNEIS
jgi:inositol phosphorylceramide synthase catalytic subunit